MGFQGSPQKAAHPCAYFPLTGVVFAPTRQVQSKGSQLFPMDAHRLLLPVSVCLLALTQVPSACQSMAVLDCQQRFMTAATNKQELTQAVAVKFCNGTSEGREAF
jgi:hypothetical protein